MKSCSSILKLICFFAFCHSTWAQSQNVDKIIAKIDNYIILKSDLEAAYQSFLSSGQGYTANAKCEIFRQLVVEKVLAAKAEIDSVMVSDEEVATEVERRMQYFIMEAGSEEILEKGLKKPLAQMREDLKPMVKEQLTTRKMREKITEDIKVTPSQVRKFFKAIPKDSIPLFPAEYEVAQIIKHPIISKSEKNKAIARLNEIRSQIIAGTDFGDMASKYSEDYGTAAKGGALGFNSRGQLAPQYEETIFKLQINEISEPIETEFGFHIIQLLERRGNRFSSRHILIRPRSNEDDFKVTMHYVDSVRNLIVKDSMAFEKAAKEFSDDRMTKSSGGFLISPTTRTYKVAAEEMDYGTFKVIDTMTVGTITKPMLYRTEDGKDAVRMLYFKSKNPPHEADFEKDYERIYQAALSEEKNQRVDVWFMETIKELYIDIDKEYNECDFAQELGQ